MPRWTLLPVGCALVLSGCGLFSAREVTAGGPITCFRTSVDTVKCWGGVHTDSVFGSNFYGSGTPNTVPNVSEVTRLAIGALYACSLDSKGRVECWTPAPEREDLKHISGLPKAEEIAGGAHQGCARAEGGRVYCWDWSSGSGEGQDFKATEVEGLSGVVQLAVGSQHTCARMEDGTVRCWGDNSKGQLGFSGEREATTPTAVPDLVGVAEVALGAFHTCARMEDGRCAAGVTTRRGSSASAGRAVSPPSPWRVLREWLG